MTKIAAILFDFGGTLDGDGVDWFTRFFEGIRRRDRASTVPQLTHYAEQAARDITALPDTHQLSMEATATRLCQRIHELMEACQPAPPLWKPDEVAAEFMAQATTSLQRNRQVLHSLRRRFRLGVVSNNWGNAQGWCDQFELSDYLDCVIDSAVVGAAKPAAEIFEAALAVLDLPAHACVYVGDRYDSDVLGARNAGLASVWIRRPDGSTGGGPADGSILSDVESISTLPELLTLAWVDPKTAQELSQQG